MGKEYFMQTDVMRDRFERDGYLLGLPILTPAEVGQARNAYERLEREVSARSSKGRITNAHHTDEAMWRIASHPRVLETVESLIGPDIVLLSTGFFVKPPSANDQFVAWHQDTMYWGLVPPFAITLWIAIDDADIENGCLRVIPGSHRLGLLPHRTSDRAGNLLGENQEIDPALFDEASAVDFCLRAGEASAHHGELIHGSNPNRSTRRRCGMTLRFTTPAVRPVRDGEHPFRDRAILIQGEDRFGHFNFVPKPDFPASAASTNRQWHGTDDRFRTTHYESTYPPAP
jgi:ectoine hydroxylase-related dioxygenase (phytanoyl-CoA dioxygenase family)